MIRMTLHQSGYDLRAFLRNRQSQFFTLALPVLFLVIFASVFGGRGTPPRSQEARSPSRCTTCPASSPWG
jgi:hypothetical protein